MKIGIIGIGKMGTAIARRLSKADNSIILFDTDYIASKTLSTIIKAQVAENFHELCQLASVIWIMVPAGDPTEQVIAQLLPHVTQNHIVIDGGNSHFIDSMRRAELIKSRGAQFLDCGTSGGVYGVDYGFSLTVGGELHAFKSCEAIFQALSTNHGYMYTGQSGTGHYVKMIHNGIEYGLLAAYAEGVSVLRNGYFKNLNLSAITCTWMHGAVINSFILQLLNEVVEQHGDVKNIKGIIEETGMGKWTVEAAHEAHLQVPVIAAALNERLKSEKHIDNYANKIVALLRNKLGGHVVALFDQAGVIENKSIESCLSILGHYQKKEKKL